MAANADCTDDSLSAAAEGAQQQYAFYLAGSKSPKCTDEEFTVTTRTPAKVVPCTPKGRVQFGQRNGLPTVTEGASWDTITPQVPLGTTRCDDQPDYAYGQTGVLHVAKYGWQVNRNKVCIQADTLLTCGIPLDKKEWEDNFTFAFFQTLVCSTTNFTYKDPDNPNRVYTIGQKLLDKYSFPLLDVNARQGHDLLPRTKRPWAPYYSEFSYISLAGKVKDIEVAPHQRSLSGCISMGDSPSVLVPQLVQLSASPVPHLQHSERAGLATANGPCFLSTAKHQSQYNSWIVVYDECKKQVWPLAMFEWEFAFSAHVEGSMLVFDSDTPSNPAQPKVHIDGDSQALPVPEFPMQVLNKDGEYYVAADDLSIYHWMPIN